MKMEREFPSSPRWSGQPRQVCSRDAQFLGAVEVGGSAPVDNCVCVCVSFTGCPHRSRVLSCLFFVVGAFHDSSLYHFTSDSPAFRIAMNRSSATGAMSITVAAQQPSEFCANHDERVGRLTRQDRILDDRALAVDDVGPLKRLTAPIVFNFSLLSLSGAPPPPPHFPFDILDSLDPSASIKPP